MRFKFKYLCDSVDMIDVVMLSASLARLMVSSCWSPSPVGRGPRNSIWKSILMEIDNGMIMLILDEPIANFFPTRPRFDSFSKASI